MAYTYQGKPIASMARPKLPFVQPKTVTTSGKTPQMQNKGSVAGYSTSSLLSTAKARNVPVSSLVSSMAPISTSQPQAKTQPKVEPKTQPKARTTTQQRTTGGGGPSEMDIFAEQMNLSRQQAEQQAGQLQSEYDYARELLGQQEKTAMAERDIARSQLEQALQDVVRQAGRSKEMAGQQAEIATEQAAGAAKQAERKTRGTLRGLGILSSSAAGELLSRPATQFQQASADIQSQLSNRVREIDDFIAAKTQENALKIQELLSNYAGIVDRIRTDLRFNQREKLSALQQNRLALNQALSEIRANQTNFQLAANTYKNDLLSQVGGLTPNITAPAITAPASTMTTQPTDANIIRRRNELPYLEPSLDTMSRLG